MPLPPDAHQLGGQRAARVHREAAQAFYAPLLPLVLQFRREGRSLREIARALDGAGILPRQGLHWSATQVKRVLVRALRAAVQEAAARQAERVAEPAPTSTVSPATVEAGSSITEAVTPPAPTAPRYDAPLIGCAVRQLTDRELERFRVAFGFWR